VPGVVRSSCRSSPAALQPKLPAIPSARPSRPKGRRIASHAGARGFSSSVENGHRQSAGPKGSGLQVLSQVLTAPAIHLPRARNHSAVQRELVHCAAGPVVASSPTLWCSHCSARMSRRLVAASFGRMHGSRKVSGSERSARTQGARCELRRPSHNKSLQRAARP